MKSTIGYFPHSASLTHPADRRRFVFFAKERKIDFKVANLNESYDIIYLNYMCNLSSWVEYKKRNPHSKIIFEIIDSYLFDAGFKTQIRGIQKFVTGQNSKLFWNFKHAIIEMIQTADAVVCSTPEQAETIGAYNSNVHISLDYFGNDIIQENLIPKPKKNYRVLWEGQAFTVENLLSISDVLKGNQQIDLHVVTDLSLKYSIPLFNKKTTSILNKLPINYTLHEWSVKNLNEQAQLADLALIPIQKTDPMMYHKPENKLLLFWHLSLPVITTATPAYTRVMRQAGLDMIADNKNEWAEKIENYFNLTTIERQDIVHKQNMYLDLHHTKDQILRKWDILFDSVNARL